MTSSYWVPTTGGDEYTEIVVDGELVFVDVRCDECRKAGRERPLQRFAAPAGRGGLLGILPYRRAYQSGSPYKVRDGVPHWHLRCKCGRELPISGIEVTKLLAAVDNGVLPARRYYL
jgi:hypothetical protein